MLDKRTVMFDPVLLLKNNKTKLLFQDLLSFELLDINIVQELEKIPYNRLGKESIITRTFLISQSRSVQKRNIPSVMKNLIAVCSSVLITL